MKRIFCFIMLCVIALGVTGCNASGGKDATNEVVNRDNGVDSENKDQEAKDKQNSENDVQDNKSISKDEESEEYIMQYAQANYFNKSRSSIEGFVYYSGGEKHMIEYDSKEGKKVYDLLRSRFVNVGEYISVDVDIKKDIESILSKNKVLEVKFKKEYLIGTEPHKNTNYKSIPIRLTSWIFPLEGKYEAYFTYLPGSQYTFEKIDSGDKLIEYCDSLIK